MFICFVTQFSDIHLKQILIFFPKENLHYLYNVEISGEVASVHF